MCRLYKDKQVVAILIHFSVLGILIIAWYFITAKHCKTYQLAGSCHVTQVLTQEPKCIYVVEFYKGIIQAKGNLEANCGLVKNNVINCYVINFNVIKYDDSMSKSNCELIQITYMVAVLLTVLSLVISVKYTEDNQIEPGDEIRFMPQTHNEQTVIVAC